MGQAGDRGSGLARFTIGMQDRQHNLGERVSVHRPPTVRLWILLGVVVGLLIPVILGLLMSFDSIRSGAAANSRVAFDRVSSPLICIAVPSLLAVIFGSFLISDFRKWAATLTVRANNSSRRVQLREQRTKRNLSLGGHQGHYLPARPGA